VSSRGIKGGRHAPGIIVLSAREEVRALVEPLGSFTSHPKSSSEPRAAALIVADCAGGDGPAVERLAQELMRPGDAVLGIVDGAQYRPAMFLDGEVQSLTKLSAVARDLLRVLALESEVEARADVRVRLMEGIDPRAARLMEDFVQEQMHLHSELQARLAASNRDMRLVLDNVAQGLVTIDVTGVMANERSAIVDRWFGPAGEGVSLADYLAPKARTFADHLRLELMQLEAGFLPREVCLEQLPRSLAVGNRRYRVSYEPIGDDDPVVGLLVIIEDITEATALKHEESCGREVLHAVQHLTRDPPGFIAFMREAERVLDQIRTDGEIVAIKRALHTLKGNASLFGLHVVAGLCQQIEEYLAAGEAEPSLAQIEGLIRRWRELMDALHPFLRNFQRERVEVSHAELTALLDCLRTPGRAGAAERLVSSFWLEPVSRPLERLAEQAKALASRLDRGAITCTIEHDGTRLDPEAWAPFWSSMAHVVRNAVDHGLEPQAERTTLGKGTGRIGLRASTEGDDTIIVVSDDGRGIAWEALRATLVARGLPATTPEDLVRGIFVDGVTTRDRASETSGRGVGMAAVESTLQRMGGRLAVDSAPGRGTSWTFAVPNRSPRAPRSSTFVSPPGGEGTCLL
jgi:HPt (histidine-containing phosphotransfer) domain-containing protein/two-component sensor histidine kinase